MQGNLSLLLKPSLLLPSFPVNPSRNPRPLLLVKPSLLRPSSPPNPNSNPQVTPPAKADALPDRDVKEKDKDKEKDKEKDKDIGERETERNRRRRTKTEKRKGKRKKKRKKEKEKGRKEKKEKEKEKEAVKKPVGSLILTVKLTLLADSRLFHYELEAEEDQQTITLTGRVSSEEEKAAASDIARTVPGVKAVVNKLEVSKELAQTLTKKQDEIITHLIKERFGKSATLKAANFDVKTEEGIVSLSGAVRFQVIALEAAEAARQVPGVKAVRTEKIRLEGEG
jgi:osmotically-inducible protein OsmY